MRGVLAEDTVSEMSAIFVRTPPSFPVRATDFNPISLATSKALMTLGEFPLVLMPTATSPSFPRALICLEKISVKAISLAILVRIEVSAARLAEILAADSEKLLLRLEVPRSSLNHRGLTVYSSRAGRYPVDVTLILA